MWTKPVSQCVSCQGCVDGCRSPTHMCSYEPGLHVQGPPFLRISWSLSSLSLLPFNCAELFSRSPLAQSSTCHLP